MGSAEGSVEGFAVYRQGTSVSRNSQSALTIVATCRWTTHVTLQLLSFALLR